MTHIQHYDSADVCLETESVSLNATSTVGLQVPVYTGNNTRYVRVNTRYLKQWAEMAEDLTDGGEVVVGVTPDKPMIAKTDRDASLAVAVAPRVLPEDSE